MNIIHATMHRSLATAVPAPATGLRLSLARLGLVLLSAGAILGAPGSASAQTQFLGPAFIVNDPDRTDSYPSVASNAAGTSVVAWHCDQPGTGAEICARRLSLTGRPAGAEFLVNTGLAGVQQFADVAIDNDGNFLVVWESNAAEDGDDWTVLGRLFKSNGQPLTPQTVLNSQTTSRQRDPAVAWRPGLGWVVVWESNHIGFEKIYARRFSQALAPQGPEFLVSQDASGINLSGLNINAAVDTDDSGNFVVAWQGPRQSGGSETYGRRFFANGAPRSETFRVATQPASQKQFPAIGVNASGAFVILFSRTDDTIAVRRYNSSGQPTGAEFQVNQLPASPTQASVALTDGGRFVATWTVAIGSIVTGRFSVLQRTFRANDQPLEPERVTSDLGSHPDIAVDSAHDALVVFHGTGPDAGARLSQTRPLCQDTDTAVCVQQGRFKVEVAWGSNNGDVGVGTGDLLTSETATFWFFDPANIELVLKELNGCPINSRFWVFAAGATDVEVDLAITDTLEGVLQRSYSALGTPFQTIRNTDAFVCGGSAPVTDGPGSHRAVSRGSESDDSTPGGNASRGSTPSGSTPSGSTPRGSTVTTTSTLDALPWAGSTCAPGSESLCLNQSRFQVSVSYRTPAGATGTGNAVPLSSDSGYFWFFDAGNVEILIKVIDACGFNQRFWVYAAGLTDLAIDLDVRDTVSGQMKRYSSQNGQGFGPVLDSNAFATCSSP